MGQLKVSKHSILGLSIISPPYSVFVPSGLEIAITYVPGLLSTPTHFALPVLPKALPILVVSGRGPWTVKRIDCESTVSAHSSIVDAVVTSKEKWSLSCGHSVPTTMSLAGTAVSIELLGSLASFSQHEPSL